MKRKAIVSILVLAMILGVSAIALAADPPPSGTDGSVVIQREIIIEPPDDDWEIGGNAVGDLDFGVRPLGYRGVMRSGHTTADDTEIPGNAGTYTGFRLMNALDPDLGEASQRKVVIQMSEFVLEGSTTVGKRGYNLTFTDPQFIGEHGDLTAAVLRTPTISANDPADITNIIPANNTFRAAWSATIDAGYVSAPTSGKYQAALTWSVVNAP